MDERNKGGRPSGAAWANKRSAGVRKHAQRNRIEILDTRDPLAELIRLGFEGETEELRVKALIAAFDADRRAGRHEPEPASRDRGAA